ncbi:hypothetical protein F2Q68_00025131 [Brassica cretica]|uniref:Uncharacterized protein n=1 Tax=Brassica cretica TaxID=69181 RepID=A0A8S9IGG8_BRACR|nr:hypothetical protein F2Q68_00025131 [Brassica cretica]
MNPRRWNPEIEWEFQLEMVFVQEGKDGKFGICRRDRGRRSRSDLRWVSGKSSQYGKRIGISIITQLKSQKIEGGFEDRARSYKGVVINGNGGQQDRGREKREYQGKGKRKMYEETDSKWVRAAGREYKFYSNKNQRSGHRGEEENSRHRNSRREQIRSHHQDERARIPAGLRGESIARSEARSKGRTEGKEEGEIKEKELERSKHKETKVQDQAQPSQAFLAELMETQGELSKVISNPSGGEREPSLGAAASNKLKMAQLVAAKRTVAKPGIRHGDHSKQGEEKGTSVPKHDPAKQAKDP